MAFESEPTPALTLGDLVEVEKCVAWSQTLCVPCPECGVEATVQSGLAMCCAMFEPELILAVQNSTAAGGCKWSFLVFLAAHLGKLCSLKISALQSQIFRSLHRIAGFGEMV